MVPSWIMICMVLAGVVHLYSVRAYLFDQPTFGECPGLPPCHCHSYTLTCSGTNLVTFPHFRHVSSNVQQVVVDISFNALTTVPANAFQECTFGSYMEILLNDNKITSIEPSAFRGVELQTRTLKLDNNKLTSIPSEVGSLTHMYSLSLYGNPISTMSTSTNVLRTLAPALTSISVDLAMFTSWPTELGYLSNLATISIKNFNLSPVPDNAFDNLQSLRQVRISQSNMDRFPESLCRLPKIVRMDLTYNKLSHMTSRLFSSDCVGKLGVVNLEHNDITALPNDLTSSSSRLGTVILGNNALTAVPRVLNVLKFVSELQLENNAITSIQRADFSGMRALSRLFLQDNPITYISADAFADNAGLGILSLGNTKISTFPAGFFHFPRAVGVYLDNVPVQCSCSTMANLKNVSTYNVRLYGTCPTTGVNYEAYINGDLQRCR